MDGECQYSFEQLHRHSRGFSRTLAEAGVRPGQHVGIWIDKSYSCVVALYGVWLAGAVAVPVFEGFRSRQVRQLIEHSQCRHLVTTAAKLRSLAPGALEDVSVVLLDAFSEAGADDARDPASGVNDPACIFYTSGTTGGLKGVLASHGNLLAGTRIVSGFLELQPSDRILSVLPFSFDYGLNQLLSAVRVGATLVLNSSPFPLDICETLRDRKITGLAGVPPFWLRLLQESSPFRETSFPLLRYITNSGGSLPKNAILKLKESLPQTRIYLMYGLTEAFRSTFLPPEKLLERPGSMGKAIPETVVQVLSADGTPCVPGETGELVHRGPTVALGYWNDPEATALRFRDGAVYSGDLVRSDEDGYLYFVGRKDQLLKTEGHRVNPSEVEDIIQESGLVDSVVVHGAADPVAGAVLVAHCVPSEPERFSSEELLRYCRREMPSYMVPRAVVAHASFPLTASGKVDRAALAAQFSGR